MYSNVLYLMVETSNKFDKWFLTFLQNFALATGLCKILSIAIHS